MEGGTSRLAELKGILKASSQRTSEDFAALRKSLYAVLDGYSKVQRGAGAVCGSGAEEVEQFNDTVSKARKQLQAKCELLQEAVDGARAMVEDAGDFPVDATTQGVKALLAHSHKLSYTSFAPLLGMHLVDPHRGVYMPPFPQTIQLQQTFLKQYAQEKADAEAAKQAAKAAAEAAAVQAKAAPAVPGGLMSMPIPKMPPGWKPGDPIPMPTGWNTGGLVPGPAPDRPAEVGPPVPPAEVPIDVNLDFNMDLDAGIDDDFILNAEAVEMASEDESSEEEDDEDQPPGTAGTADVEEEEGRVESGDD